MADDQQGFDPRPYLRLDNSMPENPKIVGLTDAAFRLYIECLCWCSRQLEDGVIPAAAIKRMGKPRVIVELREAGLLYDLGDTFEIHDYLRHQRSQAEVELYRQSRSERGASGAHKRWHVAGRSPSPGCQLCIDEGLVSA